MKRFLALLAALLMLFQLSAMGESPPLSRYTLRDSAEEVRVFATRNMKANIVGYIIPGSNQDVSILSVDGDWCHVSFTTVDGIKNGFVPLSYFDISPSATTTPLPVESPEYVGGSQAWIANMHEGYRLNLREEPSATSSSLGKYFTGTPLFLTGNARNGFIHVMLANTVFGWLDARYITCDALSFVPETPTVTVVNPGGGTTLRSGPGSSYDRIARLNHGTALTVFGVRSDGWYLVQSGEYVGFVAESMLSGRFSFDHGMDSDNPTLDDAAQISLKQYINTRTTDGMLNLRKSANVSAKSLGLFYTGTPVTVLSYTRSGWAYVRVGQTEGYVDADYLTTLQPAQYGVERTVRNTRATGLNLRSQPSTGGELLGFAPNYTNVTVLGELENGWCYVDHDGILAYMLGSSLK